VNRQPGLGWSSGAALFAAVALTAAGLIITSSAQRPGTLGSAPWYDLPITKQGAAAAFGLILLMGLSGTTYDRLLASSGVVMLACLVALALVWVPGIEAPTGGVHRRLGYGPFTVQPSEFAKIGMVLYLAMYCTQKGRPIRDLRLGLGVPFILIAVVFVAVEREPDLGTALVLLLTSLSTLYVAGARARHLIGFAICAAAVVAGAVLLGHWFGVSYRAGRIAAWWEPERYATSIGYQIVHSLISVSLGGWLGAGYGRGEGRFYLPASNTDYAMATVAEEFGLLGVVIVMVALGLIVAHAYRVVVHSADPFAKVVASGLGSIILWQALLNIAVVTNAIPCTGVPMPFISYGTSSLVAMLASVGILTRPAVRSFALSENARREASR